MTNALRTPEDKFADLPDWPYAAALSSTPPDGLRLHYVDEGPRYAKTFLCLHGQPTLELPLPAHDPALQRAAGHRVVAPDFLGFGRSDKPTDEAVGGRS